MYTKLGLFIGGKWIYEAKKGEDVLNPFDESVLGRLPHATEGDLNDAVKSAEKGFNEWRNTDPEIRSRVILRAADILSERISVISEVMTLEQGKPLAESAGEINQSIESLDMKNAEAGNPNDQRMIQEAIENSELGFDRINQICRHQVENSLIQFAKNALTRNGADYHLMSMFARILNERKKYHEAIDVSTLNIETRIKMLGKKHVRTFQSMVNHIFYLKDVGNVDDAEVMYQRVLSEADVLLQKPNYHNLLMDCLRRYLNDSGRHHEAIELSQRYKVVIPGPTCQIN